MMHIKKSFDLILGLDRSDTKADLCLIQTATGQISSETLSTSTESLRTWLLDVRQRFPNATVAICLEQPAGHLIPFLETYSWITLFPINPISLQKYREAFVTSRAKDDGKDAHYLAHLLLTHPEHFKPWQAQD